MNKIAQIALISLSSLVGAAAFATTNTYTTQGTWGQSGTTQYFYVTSPSTTSVTSTPSITLDTAVGLANATVTEGGTQVIDVTADSFSPYFGTKTNSQTASGLAAGNFTIQHTTWGTNGGYYTDIVTTVSW